MRIVNRLKGLLDRIFSQEADDSEPSILFHDDTSFHNVLVDESGTLTGLVDWECVSALPLWRACYYPAFLIGPPRPLEPDISRYKRQSNGEPSDLYWEHLKEHQQTLLRAFFLSQMRELEQQWVDVFNSSQVKRHFDTAVQNCDNEFIARRITKWMDDLDTGEASMRSLRERIDET